MTEIMGLVQTDNIYIYCIYNVYNEYNEYT